MSSKISIGDYQLSYTFNGVKNPERDITLVLVHGAGGQEIDWPMAWRSINDFTRGFGITPKDHSGMLDKIKVYSVDLPGHGKSEGTSLQTVEAYAQVIGKFIDALALENVIVVGHSMGAAIALTLAYKKQSNLLGIAMIGGSSRLVVSDAILEGLQSQFEATVENIVKYSWHKNTSDFFKQKGKQRMLDAGPKTVYDDFLACSTYNLSGVLDEVKIPVLVVASDKDRMVPLDVSQKMANKLPNSTFITLENCGHFLHIEQTKNVADALSNFIIKQS